MSAVEALSAALLERMLEEHRARPERRPFPAAESAGGSVADLLWNMGLNAMAYGLEAGLRLAGLTPEELEARLLRAQNGEEHES